MEILTEADILDLLLVELAIGGIPIEVVHQHLEIQAQHLQALELNARSRRDICAPHISALQPAPGLSEQIAGAE